MHIEIKQIVSDGRDSCSDIASEDSWESCPDDSEEQNIFILDHIYSDFYIIDENVHQKPLYFSDHDAISLCITLGSSNVHLERSLNKLTLE